MKIHAISAEKLTFKKVFDIINEDYQLEISDEAKAKSFIVANTSIKKLLRVKNLFMGLPPVLVRCVIPPFLSKIWEHCKKTW